jgi:hypothetical protein
MRSALQQFGISLAAIFLGVGLTVTSAVAGSKGEAFTGQVTDAMCGATHGMGGNAADCTRACVKKGSKYALVVGDKVYTLDAKDNAALDQLDKLAGGQAKVTGTAKGDTIEVSSVAPGQ